MNYYQKMIRWTGTKTTNVIVIATSVAISVSILISPCRKGGTPYVSRVYPVTYGWGYDILVKDTLFIHQESVPALEGNKPFTTKSQAMKAASQLISKLKKGESPTLSRSEIERILLSQ